MTLLDRLARSYGHDYRRMAEELDAALAEIDRLRAENARLRAENRHLRRRLADAELRLVRQAERDATYLLALHLAGLPTTRAAALEYGVSRRRWAWALALLRLGNVYQGGIVHEEAGELAAGVAWAVARCEREGMAVLRSRAPRNGYSGDHRTHPRRSRAPSRTMPVT